MCLGVIATKLILDGRLEPAVGIIVQACPTDIPFPPQIAAMLQWLLDGHFGQEVRLFVQVTCGAVAYLLAVWIFHRERLLAIGRGIAKVRQ